VEGKFKKQNKELGQMRWDLVTDLVVGFGYRLGGGILVYRTRTIAPSKEKI
jgi:hypothetical protein